MSLCHARTLVAHGSTWVRQQIRDRLREAHCDRIVLTSTGDDAIEHLSKGPYDLVVGAMRLPDLKDWGLVKVIRSGRFCQKELPIVAIYSEADGTLAQGDGREYGVVMLSVATLGRLAETAEAALSGQKKPRLLIIEDDRATAIFLTDSLSDLYQIDVAANGITGFELWRDKRHNLVLLDIMLPGLTGAEVLNRILQVDGAQPVVILTGYGSTERYRDMMLTGAAEFIDKPVSIAKLRHTCESVLRARLYREVGSNLKIARDRADELASHVRAASDYLASGRTYEAQCELKGALGAVLADPPSQDREPTARPGSEEP